MNAAISRTRAASALSICSRCVSRTQRRHIQISPQPQLQFPLNRQLTAGIRSQAFSTSPYRGDKAKSASNNDPSTSLEFYKSHSASIQTLTQAVEGRLFSNAAPEEEEVIGALLACKDYGAPKKIDTNAQSSSPKVRQANPAAAILALENARLGIPVEAVSTSTLPHPTAVTSPPLRNLAKSKEAQDAANLATSILSNPRTFITEAVLDIYVDLCIKLQQPSSIPTAFTLYAKKPFVRPGSTKLINPNSSFPRYAIPDKIAAKALDEAVDAKNITLALEIINTSYGAPAYKSSKITRKALPVAAIMAASPLALYLVADQISTFQDVVQQDVARRFTFAGLLVYMGVSTSLGLIAMTTANDQMRRITWLPGTPLARRWLWEEERKAYDKVAQAWGFQEPHQYGFEEGPEWELLREKVEGRGMILDNPALLEGMQ